MRRINVHIDEDLDERAEREARRRKVSKAALIRHSLRAELGVAPARDPLDELVGMSDAEPTDDVDAVIYGE
jgi:hypothetical protein